MNVIREVLDGELEVCAAIIRKSFATVAAEFGLTKENCPTNGAFLQKERLVAERHNGIHMYLLLNDEKPVGFFALGKVDENIFTLEKLAVLPEYRHLGYGKAMIESAKELVKDFGGSKISIGIIEENLRLRNWYFQHGFIHTGTRIYPHLPFTVGFMVLPLAASDR